MAKTMLQPKKDVLREHLALAADEIIRLRAEREQYTGRNIDALRYPKRKPAPWWRRLLEWVGGPWA